MKNTLEKQLGMAKDKIESENVVDRLVADELLEMGFSYNQIGTHYLHDSIVYAIEMDFREFNSVSALCFAAEMKVIEKYETSKNAYVRGVERAIERAFCTGNINYLLDTFKGVYDTKRMKVDKNTFIMTIRKKIVGAIKLREKENINKLQSDIRKNILNVVDFRLLKGICDIVISAGNKALI